MIQVLISTLKWMFIKSMENFRGERPEPPIADIDAKLANDKSQQIPNYTNTIGP